MTQTTRTCPVSGCGADTTREYVVVPADGAAPRGLVLNLYVCRAHVDAVRQEPARYAASPEKRDART